MRALALTAGLALCAALAPLAGCVEPVALDERDALLVERLTVDNARWLTRDPALLATKYRRMAADPYDWMRGSLAPWLADQQRPLAGRPQTVFLSEPGAWEVLLVGDPHPENFGTRVAGEGPFPVEADPPGGVTLSFEWNDLDAAAFGPWLLDVRRASVGLGVLSLGLAGCEVDCRDAQVRALAAAYVDEILVREEGAAGWSGRIGDEGVVVGHILEELAEEAVDEGRERRRQDRNFVDDGEGSRVFAFDPGLDAAGDGYLPPAGREALQFERLMAGYAVHARAPAAFRVLSVARKFGSGVSSLPAVRFRVLYDRGQDGPQDDDLVQLRELIDPPAWPGLHLTRPAFADQADRIERVRRILGTGLDTDARAAGLFDGAQAFKLVGWSSWFQGIDHLKVAEFWDEQEMDQSDLEATATVLGRALAAAHARGITAADEPALPVLAADLRAAGTDPGALLADELARALEDELAVQVDDQLRLGRLIEALGPTLGADAIYVAGSEP